MRRPILIATLIAVAALATFMLFYGGAAWLIDVAHNWQAPKPNKEDAWMWLLPAAIWFAIIMKPDDPSPAIRQASDDLRGELRNLRRELADIRREIALARMGKEHE